MKRAWLILAISTFSFMTAGCSNDEKSAMDGGDSSGLDTGNDHDTSTGSDDGDDGDIDGDADSDRDTDRDSSSDTDEDVDSDGDNDTDRDSEDNTDFKTDSDAGLDSESASESGSGSESSSGSDSGDDSDTDAGTDTVSDNDTETDIGTGSGFLCYGSAGTPLENGALPAGYCAWRWAANLGAPRGIAVNDSGDVLVIAKDDSAVVLLYDDDGDGVSGDDERVALASANGLNHGIALHGGYLYASSATTVYRWAYTGDRQPLGDPTEVATGMPTGGHSARTVVFDSSGNLYVNIGSGGNLDSDSSRARVIRFTAEQLEAGATFAEAELIGDGTRNENALGFDLNGRLWGVENGSDNLARDDLGGDIHTDNPGEELNLFDRPGAFYGYPYCWSEGNLAGGMGPATQWAYDPSSEHTDAWCRDLDNVVPPVLVLQAHSAPLGIRFYPGGLFPDSVIGDAFVAYHGSWNRQPETGYKVVHLPFDAQGMPTGEVNPFLEYDAAGDSGNGWPYRPVEIAVGRDGRLFITSDADGSVIAIGFDGE